jgi:hypothetical protein
VSNYLETAIERAVLIAFTQHCEKFGASNMSDMNTNILDQAENTTKTLLGIKDVMFKQNLEHRQLEAQSMHHINSMTGMIPPLPVVAPKKSPRVKTNEDMLLAENEALKKKLEDKEAENQALGAKLAAAYNVVKEFRDSFGETVAELNSKVFEVQSEVYRTLGGSE